MALSRSLFCFSSPSISSLPAAAPAAAIDRVKVQFLVKNPYPKLGTRSLVPWIPRRFQSRGFSGEHLYVAATSANDPQGQVEASSREGSDRDKDGEVLIPEGEVIKKPPRRRRRTRRKVEVEASSPEGSDRRKDGEGPDRDKDGEEPDRDKDGEPLIPEADVTKKPSRRRKRTKRKVKGEKLPDNVLQEDGTEEAVALERLKSTGLVTTFEPTSREVVVEESFLGTGVVARDNVDAATGQKSSSSSKFREVTEAEGIDNAVNGANGGELTSISGTEELEQAPVVKEKKRKKRRSRKPKEAGAVSNGSASAITDNETEGEQVDRGISESTRDFLENASLEPGVVAGDNVDAATGQKSSSSSSSREREAQDIDNAVNGANGGEMTSISGTEELEQAPVVIEKKWKKKRSGKPKDGRAVSNETASAITDNETEGEEVDRTTSESNSGALVVEKSSLQPGVIARDNVEAQVVDNAVNGANSGEMTSISGTEKLEQALVVKEKKRKKKRSRKPKEAGAVSDETASSITDNETEGEEVDRTTSESNSGALVVEKSSLQPGVIARDNVQVQVVDNAVNGANSGEVTSTSGTEELEQAPVVKEKKKKTRRGRKAKEAGAVLNGTASAIVDNETEGEQVDFPAKLPFLSWGDRWWEEVDSMKSYEYLGGREDEGLDVAEKKVEISAEEPTLDQWLKKKIRRKVFPREEPWLLESMIMNQRNVATRKKNEDAVEGVDGGTESVVAPEVQVEILINSPQCTMQRMAIVEDGKLVELHLEPLNTKVQVGNVYLGVVRQLLPGMTGVFVDIGGFQLALLDIARNQYPYTFPSIGQSIDVPCDGQKQSTLDDDEDTDRDDSETEDEDEDEDEYGQDGEFVDDEEGADGELDEEIKEDAAIGRPTRSKGGVQDAMVEDHEAKETRTDSKGRNFHSLARKQDSGSPAGPITVNFGSKFKKWRKLQEGMQIIVQVKKEALGKKGPRLTAFPSLAGRFWILIPGGSAVGVSRRITGPERKRLRQVAKQLLPPNFSLTVRTEALGLGKEDLEKDLARLMETWKEVLERASAAAVAAEHGMEGATPVLLHRAMGQFLRIVRDFFNNRVHRMVIDSPQCYQEVTSYLQDVAPHLSDRVELYTEKVPIFDAFEIESEIEKFSNRRVSLPNGGYLIMEETEALVSIDVNGGTSVLSHDLSQEEAILAVNLAAARQIATELRLRDVGGIIVVDFIDMEDPKSEKLVLEEMRKAIARDRSSPSLSEISEFGLMEMTRKRVRPSVTLTISESCSHCGGVGRVEAYETTLSKIERAVLRLLAAKTRNTNSLDSTKWPQFILRVDHDMGEYLKGRKRKRMTQLSAALKVWLNLKVAMEFTTGQFQVFEQHRIGSEKRANGAGQTKSNQQNIGPDLFGKRGVWPGKRRRNFASQGSTKE
ncbi:unnamed protein product [Calypogeia fissa]